MTMRMIMMKMTITRAMKRFKNFRFLKLKIQLLPKWKMALVGAAIFLCFALLYPSVFGPMLSSFLGGRKADGQSDHRNVHPSMTGPHPGQRGFFKEKEF